MFYFLLLYISTLLHLGGKYCTFYSTTVTLPYKISSTKYKQFKKKDIHSTFAYVVVVVVVVDDAAAAVASGDAGHVRGGSRCLGQSSRAPGAKHGPGPELRPRHAVVGGSGRGERRKGRGYQAIRRCCCCCRGILSKGRMERGEGLAIAGSNVQVKNKNKFPPPSSRTIYPPLSPSIYLAAACFQSTNH